jgi:hypothetical protein
MENNKGIPVQLKIEDSTAALGYIERLLVTGKVSVDMLHWLADIKQQLLTATVDQELDMLDRIVHDLPMREVFITNLGSGVKLYDVASLYPQEVTELWKRIPEFDNYEMDMINKVIRNRWTKRTLEVTDEGGTAYTEMHDKDGFPHYISVEYVFEELSK